MRQLILVLLLSLLGVPQVAATSLLLRVDETYPVNTSASSQENLGNGTQSFDFHLGDFRYQCDNIGGVEPEDCNALSTVGFGYPPGTLKNLSYRVQPNDTSCVTTATILKNGVTTALTCSLIDVASAFTHYQCSDTVHTVAVASGDKILLRLDQDTTCQVGRRSVAPTAQVEFVY